MTYSYEAAREAAVGALEREARELEGAAETAAHSPHWGWEKVRRKYHMAAKRRRAAERLRAGSGGDDGK